MRPAGSWPKMWIWRGASVADEVVRARRMEKLSGVLQEGGEAREWWAERRDWVAGEEVSSR